MKIMTLVMILLAMLCFVFGLYCGAILQQEYYFKVAVGIAEGLEGTNIEVNVDLNETELIEGFKKEFIPILNQTIKGEDKQS